MHALVCMFISMQIAIDLTEGSFFYHFDMSKHSTHLTMTDIYFFWSLFIAAIAIPPTKNRTVAPCATTLVLIITCCIRWLPFWKP